VEAPLSSCIGALLRRLCMLFQACTASHNALSICSHDMLGEHAICMRTAWPHVLNKFRGVLCCIYRPPLQHLICVHSSLFRVAFHDEATVLNEEGVSVCTSSVTNGLVYLLGRLCAHALTCRHGCTMCSHTSVRPIQTDLHLKRADAVNLARSSESALQLVSVMAFYHTNKMRKTSRVTCLLLSTRKCTGQYTTGKPPCPWGSDNERSSSRLSCSLVSSL